MDNNSFVIYHTYYDTYKRLKKRDPALAAEFIDAILAYGFTGEMPGEDSIVWDFGLTTMFSQIDASTNRYERAVKNGGGRPSANITIDDIYGQIEVCDTWKEIAAALKIDADTLRAIRQKYGLTERNPRKYKNSENRKTEKPNPDSFSVNPIDEQESGNKTSQKIQNRKTEKPCSGKPNTSALGITEVFRSQLKTMTTNETKNRKTEKPKNETEKPKNLNDNDNVNYNVNNLQLPAEAEDDSIKSIRTKTEKPKNLVEEEKPNGIRFFSNDDFKTEKPKNEAGQFFGFQNEFHFHESANNPISKRIETILNSPLISEGEAAFLMEHSDLPLYREGNKLVMEDDDREWNIM